MGVILGPKPLVKSTDFAVKVENSPIYYSSAEKTSKGVILDFFWMVLDNLTETSYFGRI